MTRRSLTHETVDGIAWQSFAIFANVVLRTVILIVLTRTLSPEDFGIIAAAMVVISVTEVLCEIGVARVLVQRLELPEAIVKSAFAISLWSGLAASIAIYFTAPLSAALFEIPELEPFVEFLSIVLVVNAVATISSSLAQRERKFRAMGLIELGAFLAGFGFVALPLAQLGYGAWSLAIGYFVQCVLKLVAYWIVSPPAISLWPRTATRELLLTGAGYMAGQGGNFVARQIDYLIVGRVMGAAQLGFYNRAYQFLMFPAQLFGKAAARVLFPSIAAVQDQPDRVARAFKRALGMVAMTTLPASGFLIVIAPELVLTLFGDTWRDMTFPFQVLISGLLFRTSYKISDSASLALGSMYARAWRQWIYAGAVAVGAYAGSAYSLGGVAVGVTLAVFLNFLIMTELAISITSVSRIEVMALHVRHVLIAAAYTSVIYLCTGYARGLGLSDIAVLCIATAVAVLLAALLWFMLPRVFGEDGKWLNGLLRQRLPILATKFPDS